ncbi:hypothetical protein LCGC14_0017110 [marine sediment metagenome]|uniref:Uncharacterized protein n=1 Tax=marine sediment metagenome TaxID=412755 RepID=A0A0F9W4E8_9ZZZZ|nr:hypothetical protein [Phycisphaerae bacterium]HDZ42417.1 hypothetical protein [Phycisphaerae bacterium]
MAAAFEESLTERNDRGESTRHLRKCDYHDKLVAEHVRCSDEIISFNYDCVIDDSLRRQGGGIWNPRYGYGFNLGPRGARMTGDAHWMPGEPGTKDQTVKLYKLHGSFHFQISGMDSQDESGDQAKSKEKKPYTVILKRRPYTKQKGSLRFSIIPPEWHKAYDEGAFADLWAKAAKAIHRADSIVFIGYSLPATDLHSTALFRTSVGKAGLKHLTVVNPDQEARRRVRTVLQRGCTKGTRMLSFDSLEHFAAADRSLWARS